MLQEMRADVLDGGRRVRLTWPDGAALAVSARWFYDHADDAREAASGQRRHGALALEEAVARSARIEGDALVLEFPDAPRRAALTRLRPGAAPGPARDLWLTPDLVAASPPIRFEAYLADDAALARTLRRVVRGGIALLSGAGDAPQAVEQAVARFGFIRETNYGRLFDVRVEAGAGNLAYTERALDLHTDNPYRTPAPSLQLLHALKADEDGGGHTHFVDGFAHAEALRRDAPEAFDVLAREPVRFAFADASGARWSAQVPVLRLDAHGALEAVHLNHRSMDIAPRSESRDADRLEAWYDAYLMFYRRLHAPEAAYVRRLEPGDMVIFDNRRILHGRGAFARRGARWLRGAYADVDGLNATLARLAD